MNKNYLLSIFEKIPTNSNTETIRNFLIEFDYATKYLSSLLKVKTFAIYIMLFKKAYFELGTREIQLKHSEIGKYMVSEAGNTMDDYTYSIKKAIQELVRLDIIEKSKQLKPGQPNEYIIKLPSEVKAVKELITTDISSKDLLENEDKLDYYVNPNKRLILLERDNYRCNYCLKSISKEDFYLDHIIPQSSGGLNYKSNLLSSCKSCNTKKNAKPVEEFLLNNYRSGLLTQEEYLQQKEKIDSLKDYYNEIICKV